MKFGTALSLLLSLLFTARTMPEFRIRHKKKRDPRRHTLNDSDETAQQISAARELMQQDANREVGLNSFVHFLCTMPLEDVIANSVDMY